MVRNLTAAVYSGQTDEKAAMQGSPMNVLTGNKRGAN